MYDAACHCVSFLANWIIVFFRRSLEFFSPGHNLSSQRIVWIT